MQQMNLAKSRPFVTFEQRPVQKRRAIDHPTEAGMLYTETVDYVKVTPMGSKDIFEKAALEWLESLDQKVSMGMESEENRAHYLRMYESWKKGVELPLSGTPIKGWALATFAEQEKCIALHILTVEDLANCNAEAIGRMGMGAQTLRNRAEDFLKAQKDTGPMVMQIESLKIVVAELQKRSSEQDAELRVLRGMQGIPQPRVQAPTTSAYERPDVSNHDLIDDAVDAADSELSPV